MRAAAGNQLIDRRLYLAPEWATAAARQRGLEDLEADFRSTGIEIARQLASHRQHVDCECPPRGQRRKRGKKIRRSILAIAATLYVSAHSACDVE
jgi:hypothetical protein